MIGTLLLAASLHFGALYCDHKVYGVDTWPEYAVTKAILRDHTFTVWINFGWQGPKKEAFSLTKSDPFGIQMDGGTITSIHPLTKQKKASMALSFPNLSSGEHRFRLGSLEPTGAFFGDSNSYCFTVPGHALWLP